MEDRREKWGPGTMSVHGAPRLEGQNAPLTAPIYQSAVFTFKSLETVDGVWEGISPGHAYSRMSNPNLAMLESSFARWHGAQAAISASSGMAAIYAPLMALTAPGEAVMMPPDLYGGTVTLARQELASAGRGVVFMEGYNARAALESLTDKVRILLVETVSNPLMKTADIPGLARFCQQRGILLMVDNTLASPVLCRPLELGADLVMESATKYLAGNSTVIGGVLAGRAKAIELCRDFLVHTGSTLDPFAAWLIGLGLHTLALRVRQASENARGLAAFLEEDPRVRRVYYPGEEVEGGQEVVSAVLPWGRGAMLSFELPSGRPAVEELMERLQLIRFAPTLGDVRTIITHPATTSHRDLGVQGREAAGIAEGLVRLSVGIEDLVDLKADLEQALPQG